MRVLERHSAGAHVDAEHRLRYALRADVREGGDEELPIRKEGIVQLIIALFGCPGRRAGSTLGVGLGAKGVGTLCIDGCPRDRRELPL